MRLYKSGTRIRAKVLRTDDGAQAFQGWYDTELETDCYFQLAEDGKTRCLPTTQLDGTDQASPLYGNSTCSQKVYPQFNYGASCNVEMTWVRANISTCQLGPKIKLYRNPQKFAGTTVYQKQTDGSCVDVSSSYAKYYWFLLSRGEEVGPGNFVEARTEVAE